MYDRDTQYPGWPVEDEVTPPDSTVLTRLFIGEWAMNLAVEALGADEFAASDKFEARLDALLVEEKTTALSEGIRTWALTSARVGHGPYSVPGQMIGLGWYVSLERLRWNVLMFLPLLFANLILGRGVGPTDFHGLLTALEGSMRKLSADELNAVLRIREYRRGLGQANHDLLMTGWTPEERELFERVVEDLVDAGIIREADGGYKLVL